jgi:hypothetical protein
MGWRIRGTYFESCNCDAICPCRMIGGIPGGRSTHGICFGALAWRIDDGHAGALDLAGLAVVLTTRYDDDEPGSPWSMRLHLDERGIPGYHQPGTELTADAFTVDDGPFQWELAGNCAFVSAFDYAS